MMISSMEGGRQRGRDLEQGREWERERDYRYATRQGEGGRERVLYGGCSLFSD
jgi:hypothetical protein